MVGFYKHDIPAWMDGTEALSDGAYRVYHVIIQLIMLHEGPITLNARGIAGRCNQTLKTFNKHLSELLAAGKLAMKDDQIWNARAQSELEFVWKNRENAGKGGKTPRNLGKTPESHEDGTAKSLKNNERVEAALPIEEKREEKNTPKAPKGAEPEGFPEWWAEYPKRDGTNSRAGAARRYGQAVRNGVTTETLLVAVRMYAAELRGANKLGTEFVRQAQVFLSPRERLWEDYAAKATATVISVAAPAGGDYLATLTDEQWGDHVRRWKTTRGSWSLQAHTAPPDSPRTKVPQHVLNAFCIKPFAAISPRLPAAIPKLSSNAA